MTRLGLSMRAVLVMVVGSLVFGGGLAPPARAVEAPDKSEVVLVLDYSASILRDKANRDRFAVTLERMADRVDQTSADLVAGDTTVSIIQFAAKAADYKGCTDLHLLADAAAVGKFSGCLRSLATAYRKGLSPALTRKIGVDTNYVAALELAAKHLPADAVRPALILFTDGKHDVAGVPASRVPPTLDRLFGRRSPIAILPVGMGIAAKDRAALEAGLNRMRIIKDMPACVSGATFDWPQTVFETADEAGTAVAVALQEATCTFTVILPPTPVPTPPPSIAAVSGIRVIGGDGQIELSWAASAASIPPIIDYKVRCRAGEGDWIESTEGVSLDRVAVVEGLTNGTEYQCEVAAIGPDSEGPWTAAALAVTPTGRPAPPGKPSVSALNQAVRVGLNPVPSGDIAGFSYECSSDGGTTWSSSVDVPSGSDPSAEVEGLTNGTEYVCRAFAQNTIGTSDPSPNSDTVKPCGTTLDCTPILAPFLVLLGIVLVGGLAMVIVTLIQSRRRGYVLAVVDVVHTANLGYGRKVGLSFIHAPGSKHVTDVVAEKGSAADLKIRNLGNGRFEVTDRHGKHAATEGVPIMATDSLGGRHEVILRAFNTNAASPVASRR